MSDSRIAVGSADLSGMLPYLERAATLQDQFRAADDLRPELRGELTARYMDEQQPAGTRVYIQASRYVTSAFEHADALWALIGSDHGLTPQAPWTLMRGIFEHSLWATYLLDPEDGRTRRRRALNLELWDWRERKNWLDTVPKGLADVSALRMSDTSKATYEAECHSVGLAWAASSKKPNLIDQIPKLAVATRTEDDIGPYLLMAWRSLSGHQHGLGYAALLNGDTDVSVKVAGGSKITLSVNDDAFVMLLKSSYALLMEAAALFVRRSTS